MPRAHREKASRKKREIRIDAARRWDPFAGDTEALKLEIERRLLRHMRAVGQEGLLARIRARGLEPPVVTGDWDLRLRECEAEYEEARQRLIARGARLVPAPLALRQS